MSDSYTPAIAVQDGTSADHLLDAILFIEGAKMRWKYFGWDKEVDQRIDETIHALLRAKARRAAEGG